MREWSHCLRFSMTQAISLLCPENGIWDFEKTSLLTHVDLNDRFLFSQEPRTTLDGSHNLRIVARLSLRCSV